MLVTSIAVILFTQLMLRTNEYDDDNNNYYYRTVLFFGGLSYGIITQDDQRKTVFNDLALL